MLEFFRDKNIKTVQTYSKYKGIADLLDSFFRFALFPAKRIENLDIHPKQLNLNVPVVTAEPRVSSNELTKLKTLSLDVYSFGSISYYNYNIVKKYVAEPLLCIGATVILLNSSYAWDIKAKSSYENSLT